LAVQAKTLLDRLEKELALKTNLIAAIAARDKIKLGLLISEAQTMNFSANEVSQAIALVQRIEKEEILMGTLKDAMVRQHLDDLNRVSSTPPIFNIVFILETDDSIIIL
jgi:hypothetical protein